MDPSVGTSALKNPVGDVSELMEKNAAGATACDVAHEEKIQTKRVVFTGSVDWEEARREAEALGATFFSNREIALHVPAILYRLDERLVGSSLVVREVRFRVICFAAADASVLITGETGTGKDVVAEAIHGMSRRRREPFIAVNCAAIPAGLAESTLFGHERGAFTGAHQRRVGELERAGKGSLFLDELGELSLGLHAKLLRACEEKKITRVGGSEAIPFDARVIAATNVDATDPNLVRPDLYFRLSTLPVALPALRTHLEDLPEIIVCLQRRRKHPARLTHDARELLLTFEWVGNVRQLEGLLVRLSSLRREAWDAAAVRRELAYHARAASAAARVMPLSEAADAMVRSLKDIPAGGERRRARDSAMWKAAEALYPGDDVRIAEAIGIDPRTLKSRRRK